MQAVREDQAELDIGGEIVPTSQLVMLVVFALIFVAMLVMD